MKRPKKKYVFNFVNTPTGMWIKKDDLLEWLESEVSKPSHWTISLTSCLRPTDSNKLQKLINILKQM